MMVQPLEPLFHVPTETATSAKQLLLEVVPMEWAVQLNHDWHSQLPILRGVGFGDLQLAFAASFDGGVYGVAVWTRPVASNRIAHPTSHLAELRRLAIPEYAPKYTATRMLGRMARWFRTERSDVCRLLSYQMTDVHTGTIYKAANWTTANTQQEHQAWNTLSRSRPVDQNASPKVRWELQIRKCDTTRSDDSDPECSNCGSGSFSGSRCNSCGLNAGVLF